MKKRRPRNLLIVGGTGSGKTHRTVHHLFKNYITNEKNNRVVTRKARPVLIYDFSGEFNRYNYKAIAYDVDNRIDKKDKEFTKALAKKYNKDRTEVFRKIKKPLIYRLLARHADGMPYSEEESMLAIKDIITSFTNGFFLIEDLKAVFEEQNGRGFSSFVALLSVNRHRGLDVGVHLQNFGLVSPSLIRGSDYLRLHLAGSIQSYGGASKYKEFYEVIRIAEIMIKQRFLQAPNILVEEMKSQKDRNNATYYCYIDTRRLKILPPADPEIGITHSNKDFIKYFIDACDRYLSKKPALYRDLLKMEDDYGNKIYKTVREAKNKRIKEFMRTYLLIK